MVGDVLMSSLLCEHLKTNENCAVDYLIHEHAQDVVLGNPFVDNILIFPKELRKNKVAFFNYLWRLRKQRYDAVIDVYGKIESSLISLFVKSPLKISYRKWYSRFIYDITFVRGAHKKTPLGDAIETRLVLLTPLVKELKAPGLIPKIHISNEEQQQAKKFLKEHKVDLTKPILIVGALGSSESKTYPNQC